MIENIAHSLLYLCLAWAIYLGIQCLPIHLFDVDLPGLAWVAVAWALGFAVVYSVFWIVLSPRAFTGFGKRFHLCAASLVVAFIAALALLVSVNVRYDMAPQIQTS